MKRNTTVFALLVLLGMVAYPAEQTATNTPPEGFGKKVAGTYVVVGVIGEGAFEGLVMINVDGTMSTTNTNCCGGALPGPQSPGHGVWEKTGAKQITITAVIYTFQPDGSTFLTARPKFVVDFDAEFETASSPITTELFAFGQDVTDPNEIPLFGIVPGFGDWSRLNVMGIDGIVALN